jgi:hypothetical protein
LKQDVAAGTSLPMPCANSRVISMSCTATWWPPANRRGADTLLERVAIIRKRAKAQSQDQESHDLPAAVVLSR